MSELLARARRNLSIGADLGHGCAMEALREAFAEIDRLTAPRQSKAGPTQGAEYFRQIAGDRNKSIRVRALAGEAANSIERLTDRVSTLQIRLGEAEEKLRGVAGVNFARYPASGQCVDCEAGPCYMNCSGTVAR